MLPLPPQYEPSRPPLQHEPEPVVTLRTWRPRGRWPALLRMAWLLRVFAVLSLIAGAIIALVDFVNLVAGRQNLEVPAPPDLAAALGLHAAVAILSAIAAFIIWLGLAELILLFIAIERHTRQTRDRLPRHETEQPPVASG